MQTVRQAFTILKQNPLLSTISILGTASITMIMAIVIIFGRRNIADLEPEVEPQSVSLLFRHARIRQGKGRQ